MDQPPLFDWIGPWSSGIVLVCSAVFLAIPLICAVRVLLGVRTSYEEWLSLVQSTNVAFVVVFVWTHTYALPSSFRALSNYGCLRICGLCEAVFAITAILASKPLGWPIVAVCALGLFHVSGRVLCRRTDSAEASIRRLIGWAALWAALATALLVHGLSMYLLWRKLIR